MPVPLEIDAGAPRKLKFFVKADKGKIKADCGLGSKSWHQIIKMILRIITKLGLKQQWDAMKLSLCLSTSTSVSAGCPYVLFDVAICMDTLARRKAWEEGNRSWMKHGLSSCWYYAWLNNLALQYSHSPARLLVEVRDLARICCHCLANDTAEFISLGRGVLYTQILSHCVVGM